MHYWRLQCVLSVATALLIADSWQGATPLPPTKEKALRLTFIERCNSFQLLRHPELFPVQLNCNHLWAAFQAEAFNSSGCYQDVAAYDRLASLADHRMPPHKFVFWSGVLEFVRKMRDKADLGYFTLEKTLIGYTLDRQDWCGHQCSLPDGGGGGGGGGGGASLSSGSSRSSSVMSVTCKNYTNPFWIGASKWFASKAFGRAAVIINASNATPFRETSFFGKHELPLISPARVSFFTIYMLNSLRDNSTGSCNHTTVIKLKQRLREKGIPYKCIENPNFLVRILCMDQPDAKPCSHLIDSGQRLRSSLACTVAALLLAVLGTKV